VNAWLNAIAYQATWIAAIAGAAAGYGWVGPVAALAFAAWQLPRSHKLRADLALIGCALALGFVLDSLFARGGVLRYAAAVPWPDLAPAWILALWVSFALTLNHSLAYLQRHLQLAALLGAIGAPLAYSAAERSGALAFSATPSFALLLLAVCWAVLAPALCALAARLANTTPPLAWRGVER
jgi:hypothetical protein